MIGSSRASLAEVREQVNAQYDHPQLAQAGRDLLAVADLLGREKPLVNAIADAGRPAGERSAILEQILADRVSPLAVTLAATIAGQRWSTDSDLVDAFEYAGAEALFGAAEHAGDLDRVENELFRFGRIVAADGDLQLTLSSPALPAEAKSAILNDLLHGRAAPATVEILGFVATHLRGRRIDQAIEQLTDLAAERRGELVAIVTSAQPLTDEQSTRLGAALGSIYNRAVSLNPVIQPEIVGGLTIQVGDEVIDGSLAGKLDAARRTITR